MMLSQPPVSSGPQPAATGSGPYRTVSGKRDMAMCPGPQPQGCISSEVTTLLARQSWWNLTEELERVSVWNTNLGTHTWFIFKLLLYICFSRACAIPVPQQGEVIIVGGFPALKTVSVYSEAGWQLDLTPLNQGRRLHACGSFRNRGGEMVHKLLI